MRSVGVILAASMLLLGACASAPSEPPATGDETATQIMAPAESIPTPTAEDFVDRPLDVRVRHIVPQATRTLRDEGTALGLSAVYRIAPDVIAITGVLTPGREWDPRRLAEPGWSDPTAPDFSAVSVTVPDDPRAFLPLRTERGHCLCSPLRAIDGGTTTVHAVVGVPEGAARVSVTVAGFGTFADEPVRDLPTASPRAGLGPGHNIELLGAERAAGQVRASIRLENPTDSSDRLSRGTFDPILIAGPGPCFRSLVALGADGRTAGVATEEGCQRGYLPAARRYVDLTVTLGDPTGRALTFLPSLGAPLGGVTATGDIVLGSRDVVVGRDRYRRDVVEVMEGSQLRMRIPLAAVFDADSAEERPDAEEQSRTEAPQVTASGGEVLDIVTRLAGGAEVHRMTVAVHTSGPGTATERLSGSREQAAALVAEMRGRLDDTWTVTGTGAGSSQPIVTEGRGERALELNDRIEIRVGPGA